MRPSSSQIAERQQSRHFRGLSEPDDRTWRDQSYLRDSSDAANKPRHNGLVFRALIAALSHHARNL
jgi:hypothetical protein